VLCLILATMVILASSQIILRNLFDYGFTWGEPLLQQLVLWLGLMGAMIATRLDKHIVVDALLRILPPSGQRITAVGIKLGTSIVCGLLAYHSARMVIMDYEYQSMVFASTPAWIAESIMPIAFSVMSLRFLLQAIMPPGKQK
jgi:TRAP-type C4-dicarboxylate transport system permease small subunit